MHLNPKKSLGQHFLNSRHILEEIVATANIQKSETILEIGPGKGVLTEALLTAGGKVIAVEKDTRAHELLMERFRKEIGDGSLHLVLGDVLDQKALKPSILGTESSFALVANIPYYITGAILEKFLEHGPQPNRMVLLVQKEVADRIVARDGKESVLSISVKAFGTPRIIAKVPPGAFTPPPSVDSAILAINDISNRLFDRSDERQLSHEHFFKIIRTGFAHKRKYLMRNLESVLEREQIESIWKERNLNLKLRAEDLNTDQWFSIARASQNYI